MKIYRTGPRFFEIPHATVFLLVAANIVIYGLCLLYSGVGTTAKFGATAIPANVLFAAGAMYSSAIAKHEYWRLAAYGFLHADLLHLTTNMFCLALWGAHLERRVGSFYFIVIYICALIFGGIVSNATHTGPFLMVGASGAISGVLGALFCLWILAKIDLTANFFVVNIGLNVALALYASSIDWGAHLGGFAAGLIACAVLDLIEKANAHIFRCKFPEFVKLNTLGVLSALAVFVFAGRSMPTSAPETWLAPLVYGLACFAAIKLLDILLSIKKGLAAAVILFAMTNGALVFFYFQLLAINCTPHNLPYTPPVKASIDFACANKLWTLAILALCASLLTVVIYLPWLYRGIKDVGFIGASFRAERKRQHGI